VFALIIVWFGSLPACEIRCVVIWLCFESFLHETVQN